MRILHLISLFFCNNSFFREIRDILRIILKVIVLQAVLLLTYLQCSPVQQLNSLPGLENKIRYLIFLEQVTTMIYSGVKHGEKQHGKQISNYLRLHLKWVFPNQITIDTLLQNDVYAKRFRIKHCCEILKVSKDIS